MIESLLSPVGLKSSVSLLSPSFLVASCVFSLNFASSCLVLLSCLVISSCASGIAFFCRPILVWFALSQRETNMRDSDRHTRTDIDIEKERDTDRDGGTGVETGTETGTARTIDEETKRIIRTKATQAHRIAAQAVSDRTLKKCPRARDLPWRQTLRKEDEPFSSGEPSSTRALFVFLCVCLLFCGYFRFCRLFV